MLCNKQLRVNLKDVFVEFNEEKQLLLNQINFLQNYRNILNNVLINCKCDHNFLIGIHNELENKYFGFFPNQRFAEVIDETFDQNKQSVNYFDEIITNGSVLEIDCEDLAEPEVRTDVQLEVIPKKEVTEQELVDLTIDESIEAPNDLIESKAETIPVQIDSDIGCDQSVEPKEDQKPEDPEKCFSYLSSLINLSSKQSNDSNSSHTNDDNSIETHKNTGKTIIVEKNHKIIGFLCNLDNCQEFYKTITGLQSHLDKVHRNDGIKCDKKLKRSESENLAQTSSKSTSKPSQSSSIQSGRKSQAKQSQISGKKVLNKSLKPKRVLSVTETDKFKCKYRNCKFIGDNRKVLVEHRLATHKKLLKTFRDRNQHKCDFNGCNASFGSKYQLIHHKIGSHRDKLFKCKFNECHLTFSAKYELIEHLRTHSIRSTNKMNKKIKTSIKKTLKTSNSFKCSYSGCERSFIGRFALEQHLRKTHKLIIKRTIDNKHEIKCKSDNCSRTFKNIKALRVHMSRIHKLSISGKSLIKASNETSDTKQSNGNIPTKPCSEKTAKQNKEKTSEKQSIEKTPINKSKVVSNDTSVKTVAKVVSHGYKIKYKNKCPIDNCNRRFKTRIALKKHIQFTHKIINEEDVSETENKTEMNENKAKNIAKVLKIMKFKCKANDCKRSFKSRFAMKQHMRRSHNLVVKPKNDVYCVTNDSNDREFECLLFGCKRRFTSQFALNQHLRLTHKLKVTKPKSNFNDDKSEPDIYHYCKQCDTSYENIAALNRHLINCRLNSK